MKKVPLNEVSVANMTKEELRSFIKDVLGDELDKDKNKILSKEDVRVIVRDMIKKQHRLMYTNSAFYLDKL